MSNDEGGDNGEHRPSDPTASDHSVEQSDHSSVGAGPDAASLAAIAFADAAKQNAYIAALQSAHAANAQQGTNIATNFLGTGNLSSLQQQQLVMQQMAAMHAMQQIAMQNMAYGGGFALGTMGTAFTSGSGVFVGAPGSSGFTSMGSLKTPTFIPAIPEDPPEDAGISAGEIIAHRVWRIAENNYLQSAAVDDLWPTDDPMRGDTKYNGVHAFKTKQDALNSGYGGHGPLAVGTVALWGEVIEHETGYRAEFARVLSLDAVLGVGLIKEIRLLRSLRQRYGLRRKST